MLNAKLTSIFLSVLLLSSCQTMRHRGSKAVSPTPEGPVAIEQEPVPSTGQPSPAPETEAPKIAVILGPGGLRTFAHVGVLQEFAKAKIPIAAVVGMEMGALVGAIFAEKAQMFDVEWQMMKLKEDELLRKQLLGSGLKSNEVGSLRPFMQMALGNSRAEDTKLPFSCPSFNLPKRQVYILNKGSLVDMLSYCLPFPPLFRPHQKTIASTNTLFKAIQFLKTKGVNYFVYVSVLDEGPGSYFASAESEANIVWNLVSQSLENQWQAANFVVKVPLAGHSLTDFQGRKEILQKGRASGEAAVRQMQRMLNL